MKNARILIVEDEALVAADLEDRLTRMGYTVAGIADNGEDALRAARENALDLALMDINILGPTDGIQVADELRRQFRVPVIFLTSHADRKTLERACATEPFGYVVKPIEETDLAAAIETALCRQRAEERLDKMERWLATTLRSIGDAVVATDLLGRISFINPEAERLTGWTLREALGRPFADVFRAYTGPDRRLLGDIAQWAIHSGCGSTAKEDVILLGKGGMETPVSDNTAPIRDDAGEITGAIVIFRDLTEKRRMEAEQRRMEERVREAQRLESLGVMAAGVAHDFNNLLSAVVGNADLVEQSLPKDSSLKASTGQILTASRRGAQLCRQLLAYVGQRQRAFTQFDPGLLAIELADLLRVSINKKADLELVFPRDLPAVIGDSGQLQQVIINLVLNASEALSDQPGIIRVTAGTMPVSRQFIANAAVAGEKSSAGEHVFFEVSDTGCGMGNETLRRVFDPFFTTKFLGRGLGLAAVSGIVRAHGGLLTVDSSPGKGSTFRVLLPIANTAKTSGEFGGDEK